MRNKPALTTVMALMLCVSAFFMPMTAYAQADVTPPTLTAKVTGDMLKVEAKDASGVEAIFINEHRFSTLVNGTANVKLKDYAGNSAQIAVYAMDTAGNRSQPVMIDNPYYQAPSPTPTPTAPVASTPTPAVTSTPASATPVPTESQPPVSVGGGALDETESAIPNEQGAFTPDGTGTVVDNVAEPNGKEFFTITTENENTFYLIIDRQRDSENVYLLNAVTEADLMALAEKDENGGSSQSAIPTPTPEVKPTPTPIPTPEPAAPEKPAQEGGAGSIIFIILAALAAGGAGYYFKIVKPRKDAEQTDEFEEYEDENGNEENEGEEYPEEEYVFDDETGEYPPNEPDAEDK